MTRIISVITAVHAPSMAYLSDAYASLAAQELPHGWEWQWLVQEDGETGAVAASLPSDPRISVACSRPGGPGVARTVALARATGSLVKNLDADDQLTAGALARDIAILEERQAFQWTTSRVLDLMPDGTMKSWEHSDPPEGAIPRGSVLDLWRSNDWRLPIHPVTLCIRRSLLVALGGWMALTSAEDTGLVIAANAVSDGYFIHQPSLLYRKHSNQVTAQEYHTGEADRDMRRNLIAARGDALRELFDAARVR